MAALDECVLDVPAEVEPGPFRLTAKNELPPPYAVSFDMMPMEEGHTFAELQRDMDVIQTRLETEPYEEVVEEGYPQYLDHDALQSVEVRTGESGLLEGTLNVGTYVIVCTVPVEQFGEFWPVDEVGPIDVRPL